MMNTTPRDWCCFNNCVRPVGRVAYMPTSTRDGYKASIRVLYCAHHAPAGARHL